MRNQSTEYILRLILPILLGGILYAQVYILHYFSYMEFSIQGILALIIPVIGIFEIDRHITRYFQQRIFLSKSFISQLIFQFLISLLICTIVILACYIPLKLWDINQGSQDSIGWFHIISLGSQVFFITLIANAIHQTTFLTHKWREESIRASQLEKENIKAKLNLLKDQISPHFFFNNFNTLYGLIESKPQEAQRYLVKLSSLYRQVLSRKNEETISLEEEINTLNDYIFLLNVRFGSDIQVSIHLEEKSDHYVIPPMTLQMLLENAIKHNSFDEDNPLKIDILQKEDVIFVQNNLSPKKEEFYSSGLGLENIRNRFALLAHENISVIHDEYTFSVEIPLLLLSEHTYPHHESSNY